MKHLAIATLPMALAACAHGDPLPPAVDVRTVDRVVEVQRPCAVTAPKRPAPLAKPLPTDGIALAADLGLKLGEYSGPGAWADRMEAALRNCTKP